jgi:AraC-like DNA-binding protein/quercetin dioxygenase-like cupin family protein
MDKRDFVHAGKGDLDRLHVERLQHLEEAVGLVVAVPTDYPDGYHVPRHRHSRSQLLYALTGVVLVITDQGRWMVPPEHAMWIPAGVDHAVETMGLVHMHSVYVLPGSIGGLPENLRVVSLTRLMESLILEAVALPDGPHEDSRASLLVELLLHEIPNLPQRPLALPFPSDKKLAALCRSFVEAPSPHASIDEWAHEAGMSRRSFTRAFSRQTGLSLSTWRQQACLFAALPRLADGEAVTSVALDLGYENVAAFTTMFRRMLGKAPRNYMKGTKAA